MAVERRISVGMYAATIAWSLAFAALGSTEALLYMAPALLLAIPLAIGRYVGEEKLAELRVALHRPTPRAQRRLSLPTATARRAIIGGGRLVGLSLAERAPPLAAVTV